MTSVLLINVILVGITFQLPSMALGNNLKNDSDTRNGTESLLDDRINLNYNYGVAHAHNRDGSYSASDASSYGYKAGILYPGGKYRPIAQQTGSKANSYSSGRNPPSTFANTGSVVGPGGIRGSGNAGYSGGKGNAWAGSNSQQIAIPLGDGFGGVLLSNLRPLNETKASTKKNEDSSIKTEIEAKKKSGDSLVFN